jgi:hypothetical protein
MKTTSRTLALFLGLAFVSTASAHYLWVKLLHKEGKHGATNIYFEGGPGPGLGEYLDPFIERGKTWLRTPENPKGKLLEMEVGKKPKSRWLTTGLGEGAPRSIDSYGKWGVYRYGKTDVLLHYHARLLDVATAAELKQLARAEQLELDIVPKATEAGMQLTLLWRGKPVEGRTVIIRGAKGFKANPKTNKDGQVTFKPEAAGTYLFRTSVDEKASGTFGGKEYQLKRYHATMSFDLPLEE